MTLHKIDREKLAEKLAYDDKCYPHAKCNETIRQAAENWLAITDPGTCMGWQPIETAPKGQNVLVYYTIANGKSRIVKAAYFSHKALEASSEFYDAEYDEAQDNYFAPEGWYESLEEVSDMVDFSYYRMSNKPTHWMPLPKPPTMIKGE